MVSLVYMLCDAYESGVGHGLKKDGHDNANRDLFGGDFAVGLNEAYCLGYEHGFSKESTAWFNPTTKELILDLGDAGFKGFIPLYR